MIPFKDMITGLLMFWPLMATLFGSLFFSGALLLFLFGSALIIFLVFAYGAYALFRDSGALAWMLRGLKALQRTINLRIKKNVSESFLVKTNTKNEINDKPVLYICSPHGLFGFSWYIHFCLLHSDWPDGLPRPKLAAHSILFSIPFTADLLKSHNCIDATEETILEELKKGNSVALVLGGVEELNKTENKSIKLVLEKRRGYARIAKKAGVPIVPLITIGENELFPFTEMKWWRRLQEYLYNYFHIALPLPKWESFVRWFSIIKKPLDPPLITHMLNAVKPDGSEEEIRAAYKKVIQEFARTSGHTIEIVA